MARAQVGRLVKWSALSLVVVASAVWLFRARADSLDLAKLETEAEQAGLPVSGSKVNDLLGEPPSPEAVAAFRELVEVRADSGIDAIDGQLTARGVVVREQ